MKNIAILASGSGSNAENIVNYFKDRKDISFKIYSNKKDAFVLERAKRLGVPYESFLKSELEDGTLLSKLTAEKVDFVVLAGFLLKIPDEMLTVFPDKIVNIHPSLLYPNEIFFVPTVCTYWFFALFSKPTKKN